MKKLLLFFILFPLLQLSFYHPKADYTGNSGYTKVNMNVNESGAFTFNVPISCPPGTAGIVPQIAVGYSNQGGDGLCGTGVTISGLSAINRSPATNAQDGFIDPVDYDNNDKITIKGEVGETAGDYVYGADGTPYREEQNAHAKTVSHGNHNNFPERFTRQTKNGLTEEYGFTEDSKVEAQGRNDILTWAINKVSDTKGNYFTVSYDENHETGEHYPIRIDYTGNEASGLSPYNSIRFVYEARPDVITKYFRGSISKITKRIQAIEVYAGEELFRKYVFTYEQRGIKNTSYLTEIQEIGLNGESFYPTKFQWQTGAVNFNAPELILPKISTSYKKPYSYHGQHDFYIDIDNDGDNDKVWVPDGLQDLYVAKAQGTSFAQPEIWLANNCINGTHDPFSSNGYHERFADMNADGYTDYVWVPNGRQELWVAINNKGNGFNTPQVWLNQTMTGGKKVYSAHYGKHNIYADINGDAYPDKIWIPEGNNNIYVAYSTGVGFETPQILIAHQTGGLPYVYSESGRHQAWTDMNRDGILDYALIPRNSNNLYVFLGNGSGFDAPQLWLSNNVGGVSTLKSSYGTHEQFVDVTGDGIPDKVWVPNNKHNIWVAQGTGAGFNTPEIWLADGTGGVKTYSNNAQHETFLDVNKDGMADRVYRPKGKNAVYVALSNGNQFATPEIWMQASDIPYSTNGYHERWTDINGDGVVDFACVPNGQQDLKIFYGNSPNTGLITKITNGHGAETNIIYKPLTDNSVYTKLYDAEYPIIDFKSPIYVVSKVTSTDGIGGTHSVSYHYTGAKLDLTGRGFRGFMQTQITDNQTGIKHTTYFERDYRYISSKVKRVTQELPDGTIISETINTNELIQYWDKIHFSYIKQSITKSYETNGELIGTTITTQEFDDYGNIISKVVDYGNGTIDSIKCNYADDIPNWRLGRLIRSEQIRTTANQATAKNIAEFEYDNETGLIIKEISYSDNNLLKIEKNYEYDVFGNVIQTIYKGDNGTEIEERINTNVFDETGRFVIQKTNDYGHTQTITYHEIFGVPISVAGPNGKTTNYEYDAFGRKIKEILPNGNEITTIYEFVSNGDIPEHALYFVKTQSTGMPAHYTYYDILDREIRSQTIGFAGQKVYADKQYNTLGHISRTTNPYFQGDTRYYSNYEHDIIGRLIKATDSENRISQTIYNGLETTAINPKGQHKIERKDLLNRLVEVEDEQENKLNYFYNSFGELVKIIDAEGNETLLDYDQAGNKIMINDPSSGIITYEYNAFAELIKQTDEQGNIITMERDKLGRLTKRTENEGTTCWFYDTAENGLGKLHYVTAPNGYKKEYFYDEYSRIVKIEETIDSEIYTIIYEFDELGRPYILTYPTGFQIKNIYNEYGYLSQVVRVSDNKIIWEANEVNANGQIEEFLLGNGLTTQKTYNNSTGIIQKIETGNVQDFSYSFDELNNLTERKDNKRNLTETFDYDNLNRVTNVYKNGNETLTIEYDKLGNIIYKSDIGTYNYFGDSPHRLTSITTTGINNCASSYLDEIIYNSYHKVNQLTKDEDKITFEYGPDRLRYKLNTYKDNELLSSKIYISNIYEKITTITGEKHVHYIRTGDGVTAVFTQNNIEGDKMVYLHKDHLGSVALITDENGEITEEFSYDTWGNRRDPNTWELNGIERTYSFERGFTSHEHIDLIGLVNMNGRIYDPTIGKFLSPDPFIQEMTNLQNFNRYSYVVNNPLSLTDPSGYWFGNDIVDGAKKAAKSVGNFVQNNWVAIAAVAIGIVTAGVGLAIFGAASGVLAGIGAAFSGGLSLTATILSGAGVGFMTAFSGTMLAGGNIKQALTAGAIGAITGAVTAGVTYGINAQFPTWAKTVKDSTLNRVFNQVANLGLKSSVSGLQAEIQGGSFKNAFWKTAAIESVKWGSDVVREIRDDYVASNADKFENYEHSKAGANSRFDTAKVDGISKYPGKAIFSSNAQNVGKHGTGWFFGEMGASKNYSVFGVELISKGDGIMPLLGNNIPGLNSMAVFHDIHVENLPGYLNETSLLWSIPFEYAGLLNKSFGVAGGQISLLDMYEMKESF